MDSQAAAFVSSREMARVGSHRAVDQAGFELAVDRSGSKRDAIAIVQESARHLNGY